MKMNFKHTATVLLSVLSFSISWAQPSERRVSRQDYIAMWKDEAIRQMNLHGIPASITLAQGILESADGNSELAKYANNHFGIKCHGWTGKTMYKDDDKQNECFRSYFSAAESFEDHSKFLTSRGRYASLFELTTTDYKGWARGLKKAGYATNPKYANLLIGLIEKHQLSQYDKLNTVPNEVVREIPIARTIRKGQNKHVLTQHQNKIKYIVVHEGDTFWRIAKEFDMGLWQLYKYNDLNKRDILQSGDIIYLQPKRNKGTEKYHKVKTGETMRQISQRYGIKLKALYKKNNLKYGSEPVVGSTLSLRKRVK